MTEPPDHVVTFAVKAANASPCAKSKRGAVIFDPSKSPAWIVGGGHNTPPIGFSCDSSPECRRDCGKICVHAEQYALLNMWRRIADTNQRNLAVLHVLHVKTVAGHLVPGGGPSCFQCSKLILDAGLGSVWLFEQTGIAPSGGGAIASWRIYTALEFHRVTLRNLELHG